MNPIEEQLRTVNWKNPEEIISFYESNALYFNNYELIDDTDKIRQFISVKLYYADSLFDNSQYDRALEVLNHIKTLLDKLGIGDRNYKKYDQQVRFLTGMILGNRKNFKMAYPIFKELTKEDPEHHFYQIWYQHTRLGLYNWIFNGISYLGLGMIFVGIAFQLDKKLPFDPITIGLVISLVGYLIPKGLSQYFKIQKSTNKTSK